MISDGEMVWTKVVFKKIYNFIFDYFFIQNHLGLENYDLRLII
jgi:hypothetical protein